MNRSKELFDPINNQKILIIGDIMLDHYLNGSVNRISPEAPVPIVKLNSSEYRLGGAANVAANIQAFNAVPVILSVVGKDKHGNILRDLLEASGMDSSYIFTDETRPTTRKTRILAGYQQMLRVDEEETHEIAEDLQDKILVALKLLIEKDPPEVIIFQDYNKGVLAKRLISNIITLANQAKIPTVVDPKFDQFFDFKNCTTFKPNLKEFREGLGINIQPNIESLNEACKILTQRIHSEKLLITLSEHGVFAYENGQGTIIPVKTREIVDVCGAGDAVIATCAIGLALGMTLQQIGQLSNIAGGIVCESMGVVPLDFPKMLHEIDELYPAFQ